MPFQSFGFGGFFGSRFSVMECGLAFLWVGLGEMEWEELGFRDARTHLHYNRLDIGKSGAGIIVTIRRTHTVMVSGITSFASSSAF